MKLHFRLPSIHFPACGKPAPATKEDMERTREEEGQSASRTPALPSTHKKPVRPPSWLQKAFGKKKAIPPWEPGSMLIEPERGNSLLRQLKLDEANIASGGFGSISIFKNENGDKFVGKISKGKSYTDELAIELAAYKNIYRHRNAGPHPNLVNVYGIAKVPSVEGTLERALLMDAVPGPSGLKTFDALYKCWQTGKISTAEYWGAIQFLGRRLLGVTEHISKAGVVHNDIKPENFLVNEMTGEPVLIDLGCWSKKNERAKDGTPNYSSPEYRSGQGVDERSDVFTVGASLLRGIEGETGRRPNEGLRRSVALLRDGEGNIIRQFGTYSAETAYTNFMKEVLEINKDLRVNSEGAKKLSFLDDRMLDDDAAKKVIKDAISLAKIEEQKPAEERWKRHEQVKKLAPLEGRSEKSLVDEARLYIDQTEWFSVAKRISEAVPQTPTKSSVDRNGVRIKNKDKDIDVNHADFVSLARTELAPYADTERLERYVRDTEKFLYEVGALNKTDVPEIKEKIEQVRERAVLASRMVEIFTVDQPSSEKTGKTHVRESARALELTRHLEQRFNSWHMKFPLVGLNAKFFEESILDSIQMGASDNRSWAARTVDMDMALGKLKVLGPGQIAPLSDNHRAALGEVFHTISLDVQLQQSRVEEILGEKKSASSEFEIHEADLEDLERAKKALDAVGEQVERLIKYIDHFA